MAGKREKPQDIVLMLRQVEVQQKPFKSVQETIRQIGGTVQICYRLQKGDCGMNGDQLDRMKELEIENSRLRRSVSDLTLNKLALTKAARATAGQRERNF